MSLSVSHLQILRALVNLYYTKKKPITSKEISIVIKKHDVTVRNTLVALKALHLVESKPGPGGGYIPTIKAMEYVRLPQVNVSKIGATMIYRNGKPTDLILTDLELVNIDSPSGDRAIIRVIGDIYTLQRGDYLKIGPTPFTRLIIEGTLLEKDVERGELLIRIATMASIPKEKVGNIMSTKIITVTPDMKVKDVAKKLYKNKIRAAPIVSNGKLVGLISSTDLLKVIYEEKIDANIGDVANRHVLTIHENEDILNAILTMIRNNIGRLIVVNSEGDMIGIVTRTDLLRKIAGL
ncbi:MAG: CBS domain-containing protein [Candidatus Asgardarchaeia archaeon]